MREIVSDIVEEIDECGIDSGYKAAQKLLEKKTTPPTAIFAYSDLTAIGVIQAIKEKKLRVSEDISVIGYDDINRASYTDPPLTTIRVPKKEMGILSVKRLAERINNHNLIANKLVVPTELVIRNSCREIKQ